MILDVPCRKAMHSLQDGWKRLVRVEREVCALGIRVQNTKCQGSQKSLQEGLPAEELLRPTPKCQGEKQQQSSNTTSEN